jgi:hypothetical protein
MNRFPSIGRGALLATLFAASSPALAQGLLHPALAQAIVQQATPNADRLSAQMRILASNPNDLAALIEAGRLSTRLGDPQAAVQFFARADKIRPGDPRVLAGRASALLTMERPGEALRLFEAAERGGLQPSYFAADRGLAYDLLGYPTNAQRDYRLALATERDDEVVRRLALSLGITGDVRAANQLLDPLLRQNDRAAWRVHACVLAMQGDAAGADRIAAAMLPGFGTQLAPFFRRLPSLSPADRAFAVHFGRLGSTPGRIADARLAPPVTPAPRTEAPVAPAQVAAAPAATQATPTRKLSGRERRAAAAAARRETEARQREAELAAARKAEADRLAQIEAARAAEAARVAQAASLAEAARVAEARRRAQDAALAEARRRAEAERVAQVQRASEAARAAEAQRLAEAARLADAQRAAAAAAAEEARSAAEARSSRATAAPKPPAPASSNAAAAATDTTLATIIRNLTIPADELGVPPLPNAQPAPAPAPSGTVAPAPAATRTPEPAKPEPAKPAPAKPAAKAPVAKESPAAKGKATDKDAAGKPTADKANAKTATGKDKAKTTKAVAAKPDPARAWVQIAGGANKADLPKAYRGLAAKAPALKGRTPSVASARGTNRLLIGPFKTNQEAQAFVNTLSKQGVSAFSWTSEPGQKIEQLPK